MNYSEFVQVYTRQLKDSNLRPGQLLFHALEIERPDLAEQIRATYRDPFYDDSRVSSCWAWLAVMW